MRHIRWRLRPLVVLTSVGIVAVGLLIAHSSSVRFLRTRLAQIVPPAQLDAVLADFGNAFLAFSAIAVAVTILVALLLGSTALDALGRLREDAAARARGMARPPYRPPVIEIQTVSVAMERMADDLRGQADGLRRERDELALLVHSVSEGILLIEQGGRIVRANPAAQRLLGLPDASRGQHLDSLVRNTELRTIAQRLIDAAEPITTEIGLNERRLLVVGRPIDGAENHARTGAGMPGAVIAIVDLTELRRLEGVRRDFVANVSHELKTPLTSIRGYAETLAADELDAPTRRLFLDVIRKNADRLHSIVDDLLDLSRLESGGWRPRVQTVAAGAVVTEVWASFADRAGARNITFLPPETDANIIADESALRQILTNLIDNAVRHTGPGGSIRVSIEKPSASAAPSTHGPDVHDTSDRELVSIDVRDTGTGIPTDALPRIFERFYRVDPARSRAEGGTGLGLSIVKHLVESMDGEIGAESTLGKGTTIRVRLPAAAEARS